MSIPFAFVCPVIRFARELVGRLVPEGRDGSVSVRSRGDVVDPVVTVLVVGEGRSSRVLVLRFGRAVRRIVCVRDRAAVRVGDSRDSVSIVVSVGGCLGVGVTRACQAVDDVIRIAPASCFYKLVFFINLLILIFFELL